MSKRWSIKEQGDSVTVQALSRQLTINPTLSNLLVQRGIKNFEDARAFFRPQLSSLHDPFLMRDMDKAVERIERAIKNKESILVYGDYDVDGTTSVALVYSFLITLSDKIEYYIPDRYKEGYGVSYAGIDWAKENGYSLIITLDCGIKAIEKVEHAAKSGIDFIICDHHRPGEKIPPAHAVLDPKRDDCSYPFKELSGCGIGFKLVQALAQIRNIPFDSINQYLDLVAISTAADMVPITGENRILTFYGLQLLNNAPRYGIKAILELNNLKKTLTVSDIVFVIAPRINAAGRIKDAKYAVELLLAENQQSAKEKGELINENNVERRTLDIAITEQAMQMIEQDDGFVKRKAIVLYHANWHKGVIGIVASRLIDKHYRPTVILTYSNGCVTGSARSVKGFDIYNAIEKCSDLLEQFGGHMYAAGLTMKEENVSAFCKRFEQVVSVTIEEHMLTKEIEIDSEIALTEITPSFFNILKQFAPFGPGNMAPVFASNDVRDTGYARIVGNKHLKLTITRSENPTVSFNAIAFQQGDYLSSVVNKQPFDTCYTIEENEWKGQTSLQLKIQDIH